MPRGMSRATTFILGGRTPTQRATVKCSFSCYLHAPPLPFNRLAFDTVVAPCTLQYILSIYGTVGGPIHQRKVDRRLGFVEL